MAGFVLDSEVKDKVANILQFVNASAMPLFWDDIITNANLNAYQDIYGGLISRGFTIAVVNGWDRGREIQFDLAVFWALTRGGALGSYGDGINKLDRRKDIKDMMIMIGGVWQQPGGAVNPTENAFTQIGFGDTTTGTDLFLMDPQDSRIGHTTRF